MITLALHNSVIRGSGPLQNVTDMLGGTWRRSIKRLGGFWLGTAEISAGDFGRDTLDDLFYYGLLSEIREYGGGQETWRGALLKMEYQRAGDMFIKDATLMSNAIRSIYTRIGDNMLTNGSGESGAWAAYNGATVTQSTEWFTVGEYSIKIVVADTAIRGATIQAVIPIVAGVQYVIRASLRVESGSWRLSCNRADNDQSLAFFSSRGTAGDYAVNLTIEPTNTYTGNADLRITAEAAVGTIYADAVVFQRGPARAETKWYRDTSSITEWGRKENVLLRGGKSDDDANAECQTELIENAWPNPVPPQKSKTIFSLDKSKDKLKLTFAGYWAMLNWRYTTLHGTRTASEWVSALAALQATYIASSSIDTNSMDFLVDDRGPLRLGDLLRDVALAGDSDGNKWGIGVYEARNLVYEQIEAELAYRRKYGRLLTASQDEIEPYLARPGWTLWEDLPIGPGQISGYAQHDPRWVYLDTIEMLPDGSIEFEREPKRWAD